MSFIYIVELVNSRDDNSELLGKFDSLCKSFDYIIEFSNIYNYTLVMEYTHLAEDQKKGSIISVNNLKKPTKLIYIRSELNRRRKLTM
jgi:hypothetical protein